MANILVGGILQETNTDSPLKETYDAFQKYRGQALLEHPHTAPAQRILQAGHRVVPAVYASIIPSGMLTAAEFSRFTEEFLSACTPDIDGIWLSLHGAMTVEDIGSAEARLVSLLRQRYGSKMPIFASFDFHGNMSLELVEQLNYITAYHTAPHTDIYAAGCRAVDALLECLDTGIVPRSCFVPIPMVMPGELVITAEEPTAHFQRELRRIEKETGLQAVNLFCGFAWSDCPRNRMAITVSDSRMDPAALEQVKAAAQEIWDRRREFSYGKAKALSPEEAVQFARKSRLPKILISDTGDNITAGCAGDQALLAGCRIRAGLEKALAAGITDREAVACCQTQPLGAKLTLSIGGTIDPGRSTRITVTGELIWKNTFPAEELSEPLSVALLRVGGVDILLTDQRYSVISWKRIRDTGVDPDRYRIIAVKLGYLFPDLAAGDPCSVLAMTPGNAQQDTARIPYTNAPPHYFPRDDFPFRAEFETRA